MSEEIENFLCSSCNKETSHKLVKVNKDSFVECKTEVITDDEGCLVSEKDIEYEVEFDRWFTFECKICGTSKTIDNEVN